MRSMFGGRSEAARVEPASASPSPLVSATMARHAPADYFVDDDPTVFIHYGDDESGSAAPEPDDPTSGLAQTNCVSRVGHPHRGAHRPDRLGHPPACPRRPAAGTNHPDPSDHPAVECCDHDSDRPPVECANDSDGCPDGIHRGLTHVDRPDHADHPVERGAYPLPQLPSVITLPALPGLPTEITLPPGL